MNAKIISLQEKVAKAEEKVEKIQNTIKKHYEAALKKLKALEKFGITAVNMTTYKWKDGVGTEHYWPICEVERKLEEAENAEKKLKDAEEILKNWKAKLHVEMEKDRFLNDQAPEVIKEFLEQWKEKAREWYIVNHKRYLELRDKLYAVEANLEKKFLEQNPKGRTWGREWDNFKKEDKELNSAMNKLAMLGGMVAKMATYYDETERLAWLEKELEAEKRFKMLDLITRVNAYVGTITDASFLRIDVKGNLNGIIAGDKGRAKVETIGAGGWNIQCWHYRTLVHEVK